jgi:putative peptide zinc metalloprotease protein
MAKSIFSASWYRVGSLRPRLRSHAQIHRHQYRGETWFVLQDLSMERFLRFSPAAYAIIGLMDGSRTVEEVWDAACTRLGDDAPTQDEMIHLLSRLYQTDVLQCDVTPDAAEILDRYQKQMSRERRVRLFSFFSWRFPLLDPDRFLRFALPVVKPMFGWIGALLWLAVVIPGVFLFASHWTDLTRDALDRMFMPQNILLLWLLFPVIKTFHEFGHAFATRVYGGEVHEMGVMLLVFAPVPYVDASSASAFRERWRRVIVGAAGMLVELFIASIALFVWLNAQPGPARTMAYNAIFIAGVSTLLFNGNPLLRYDGYYILADLLEIPNLRSRATTYLTYICERYLFGNFRAETSETQAGERGWLVSFGVLSFTYRMFVVVAILLFVATKLFNLGMVLALGAAGAWLVFPVFKGAHFLFTSPRIRPVRIRAVTVTFMIVALVAGFIGFVPVPYRTGTQGVIWIPEESLVRAGADGFIEKINVTPGQRVEQNATLMTLSNPILLSQEKVFVSRERELQARYVKFLSSDPVKAHMTQDELQDERSRLRRVREEIAALNVQSTTHGSFVVPSPEDLPGRYVRKGELLGYVLELQQITVRTVVSQALIDMVRSHTYGTQVRLSESLTQPVQATIKRIVPGASDQLPAKALGTVGGGGIAIDPSDRQGLTAVQKVFQIDLELPSHSQFINAGGRGYVRFDHGWAPLAVQWYFHIRQVFLSRFNV